MKIALVSPYSWTYPGGVTRHVESLGAHLERAGHDVKILAPFDPDDRMSLRLHRGARPQRRELPPNLVTLGRTVAVAANGAMSNIAVGAHSVQALRGALRSERFDVVHLHEPVVPMVCWDALMSAPAALVATYHTYSTNGLTNTLGNLAGARRRMNRLHVRIAVSRAAEWTGMRYFGGRYHIIPNGVELDPRVPLDLGPPPARELGGEEADRPLRIVFVGLPVARKGLPVVLRAFEALRDHVACSLTIVGTTAEEIAPMLLDPREIRALGKVSDEVKRECLREADVLCAPSLGGESFGMVLTEAFAAGTPVLASEIPGYSDVVSDGVNGRLVPVGDALALAEALRDLALNPGRRAAMAREARATAERYAWPHVAEEVMAAYEDARAIPRPSGAATRLAVVSGLTPADRRPAERARRLPRLERERSGSTAARLARRGALVLVAAAAVGLAFLGLRQIGIGHITDSLLHSRPTWVVGGLVLMCLAMASRGVSWYAILSAAPTPRRVRLRDALQGTFVGVLMSATLPARLGEPSRALIVARRLGRARETLPVVLGTLVSQTCLNLLALAILGGVAFADVDLLSGHQSALLAATLAPVALLLWVLIAPALMPRAASSRSARLRILTRRIAAALTKVREGLSVFRRPRHAAAATVFQLSAWALQWLSCYTILVALGIQHVGPAAAAGVLFAVNVTAVVPATPSNLGVFQAACVAVLHGGFHVSYADALAYGIILQAVEIATAVIMGAPALVKEGLSWREVRLRALHATPIELSAVPVSSQGIKARRSAAVASESPEA